ncbi:hypothetical protein GWR56_10590 [Mucilaginibacter sp. 14171R-50]|uniref:hypothetical protein n=1 Tax=Mucilaginibacter sp. 14171R-50 TaxID=2703789 RepID=UPI00138C67F9|nr:hypothetical protein [Mucilaginibacter sp. 14171R-50]QHS55960.1 hypothetical protein GWR56_10590 [Mucilaginibacter sp. 14171R-50]
MIGLPLWVKYQQRAYMYYILTPPCKRDSSFEVLLEGINCKIHLDAADTWVENHEMGNAEFDSELIQQIGKAVISHFHIKKHNYS